jgi:hypothetical protein
MHFGPVLFLIRCGFAQGRITRTEVRGFKVVRCFQSPLEVTLKRSCNIKSTSPFFSIEVSD